MNKLGSILLGFGMIIVGIMAYVRPRYWSEKHSYYIDLTDVKGPFVAVCVIAGFGMIVTGIRHQDMKKSYWICVSCEEACEIEEGSTNYLCDKCGGQLVPLKGYYKRKDDQSG